MCVCFGVCQSVAVCPCGGLCFLVVFLVGCGFGGFPGADMCELGNLSLVWGSLFFEDLVCFVIVLGGWPSGDQRFLCWIW